MLQNLIHKSVSISQEEYFRSFRKDIIGIDTVFESPYGTMSLVYADWTASGRLFRPIEEMLIEDFGPYMANTHTETSMTGTYMTYAYHKAKDIIKKHVNAGPDDVIISYGSGMTGVINKFQRILGIRVPEQYKSLINLHVSEKPVVFITHMEHHSNQTSWLETLADVVIINADEQGLVDLSDIERLLEKYKSRKTKIASVTACSNVTGIETPYHEIAAMMHRQNGYCFVDFACSAPYVDIDMHPEKSDQYLDAIFFSPHKFLGGPGTSGILIFNSKIYHNQIPDQPGGGTVKWTNPWKEHKYIDDIEEREDGGTPPILQTIKAALAVKLKEKMGVQNIAARENEIMDLLFHGIKEIPGVNILSENNLQRLGVISFYISGLHYNLGVRLLNDRFGIQVRGGCSCAGTYGHYLLNVSQDYSHSITCDIDNGDLTSKPGWIRLSIHPIMTDNEVIFILKAIEGLAANFEEWSADYEYNPISNEYTHKTFVSKENAIVDSLFE